MYTVLCVCYSAEETGRRLGCFHWLSLQTLHLLLLKSKMARELTHLACVSLTGGAATQPQVFILYQKLGRNVDEKRWTRRSDKNGRKRTSGCHQLVPGMVCRSSIVTRLPLDVTDSCFFLSTFFFSFHLSSSFMSIPSHTAVTCPFLSLFLRLHLITFIPPNSLGGQRRDRTGHSPTQQRYI